MRAIGICLLRAGDIFMLASLIRRLQRVHNLENFDLLVNDGFQGAAEVFIPSNQVYTFPRSQIQADYSNVDKSLYSSIDKIEQCISRLKSYDSVYDLSGSRVAQILKKSVGSKYRGSTRDYNEVIDHARNTQHYLMTIAKLEAISPLEGPKKTLVKANRICFIGLTSSDRAKNVCFSFWRDLMDDFPNVRFIAPVGPLDVEVVRENLGSVRNLEIMCVPFKKLFELMYSTGSVFVGVDSAVKHLAAEAGLSVFELVCGPSLLNETHALAADRVSYPCSTEVGYSELKTVLSPWLLQRLDLSSETREQKSPHI